jgi:hypothetical protein
VVEVPRPAPPVTVRDPSRPAQRLDVLDTRPDRPRPSTHLRVLCAVAAVAVAAAGATEVRDRRAQAAEQRRLDGVVQVALQQGQSTSSYDPTYRTAHVELRLQLRNTGPRDLLVLEAAIAGFTLQPTEVAAPAGGEVQLQLQRSLGCADTRPPPAADADVVVVAVRTRAGERRVEVPLSRPIEADALARACGFLPLEEEPFVSFAQAERRGDGLLLEVDVSLVSKREVEVVDVLAPPGYEVELALPVLLPVRDGDALRGTKLQVLLRVGDCGTARESRGPLTLLLRNAVGRVTQPTVDYPVELAESLVADTCPA